MRDGTFTADYFANGAGGVLEEGIVTGTYTVANGIWTLTATEFSCPAGSFPSQVGACSIGTDGVLVSVDVSSNITSVWVPQPAGFAIDAAAATLGCFADYPNGFAPYSSMSPVE
ncbi:MAG TPA: hypothetical protein VEK07_17225 [Polyangiaceae bacterium]|nr:hypothetical protein [Polyangiaceae bacterium]